MLFHLLDATTSHLSPFVPISHKQKDDSIITGCGNHREKAVSRTTLPRMRREFEVTKGNDLVGEE